MIIVWALSWWYGSGWRRCVLRVGERLAGSYDYFSIDLLARTLFAPFRQISAGRIQGPIDVQFRAFVDKTISRFIGAIVRLVILFVGIMWLALQAVIGGVVIVVWATLPIWPLIGFVAMLSGWIPSWQ